MIGPSRRGEQGGRRHDRGRHVRAIELLPALHELLHAVFERERRRGRRVGLAKEGDDVLLQALALGRHHRRRHRNGQRVVDGVVARLQIGAGEGHGAVT